MTVMHDCSPLASADRCDRCGAAGWVRVTLPSGSELLFCGHHAREYGHRLRELGADTDIMWAR